MTIIAIKRGVSLLLACALLVLSSPLVAFHQGIYLTQITAENTSKMNKLIQNAKASGIDTFIIDVNRKNHRYEKNIAAVRQHGIRYVARIVVFPHGGTHQQVTSKQIWEKRWGHALYAIQLGADAIQLDYIRYKAKQRPSHQNALFVKSVIQYFKEKLASTGNNVKLQIDIFGVAALKPSVHIGQNAKIFAEHVDTINPMVYPSHYEPFRYHAKRPYETVYESIRSLKSQIRDHQHVRVNAFIELFNYRYPMSRVHRVGYIKAQIKAAKEGGANGWYAWSANNKYGLLFTILQQGEQGKETQD